ncbi:MAG: tetratricopeptide repeat protein [Elusimicrobia bacterium]|nr:tetratricopeptide repeat protein [Elusimicrobiota bacterium]
MRGSAFASLENTQVKTVWDRLMEEQSSLNLRKGYALMNSERYPEAADEFLKALEKTPDDPSALVLYGASLYWLGEPQKAVEEFDSALKRDPRNAMAFQLKGIVRAWQGDYEGALDNFTRSDAIAGDRADIKMNIGSIYHSMGLYEKALDYSRLAVSLEPDNPLYRFQIGLLYSRLGRYDQAAAELKKALSIYPDYEDAMLELAALYDRRGDYGAAVKLYRKALVLKPGDSVVRFRLAWTLLKTGERSGGEIKKVLEGAFLLTPKNDKGGISITLAYAGGGGPGSETHENTSAGDSPLENAVAKIPEDEDVKIKVEILELPKTGLVKIDPEKPSALKDQLSAAYKRPRLSYTKKEYFMAAGKSAGRLEKAAAISAEVKKMMQDVSPGNDAKLSLNIETHKSAGSREAAGAPGAGGPRAAEVSYKPRNVGNDMGLWVMGDNWLENVSDAVEEMENPALAANTAAGQPRGSGPETVPEFGAVLGLGYLLLGRADSALDEFDVKSGVLSDLGRTAALVEKGDEAGGLKACREALKKEPENQTALSNIKWLSGGGLKQGEEAQSGKGSKL